MLLACFPVLTESNGWGFKESALFCRELAYVIENSQAGTVLTTQEFAPRVAPLARKAQARCLILNEVAATSDTFSSGSATLQQPLPDTGKRSIATLSSLTCLARPIRQAVLIECVQPSAPDAAGNAPKLHFVSAMACDQSQTQACGRAEQAFQHR